jgi:hypothetical protein
MSDTRWTVRHVERTAIAKLREVAGISGEPIGVLVSAAIEDWYRRLPTEGDPLEPIEPFSLAFLFRR